MLTKDALQKLIDYENKQLEAYRKAMEELKRKEEKEKSPTQREKEMFEELENARELERFYNRPDIGG